LTMVVSAKRRDYIRRLRDACPTGAVPGKELWMMEENKSLVIVNAQKILGQVAKAVEGKDHILVWVMAGFLAKGHILMEDIPGVGKTNLAVAFAKALGLTCNRVQFTPDVLPSDVTGYSVPDPQTHALSYRPGAVLCNLFLADELNRATSRTQSALLEAMEEGQVTVDGTSHKLPDPFLVIATQNPTGAAGTQLLPDSQLDRFTLRLSLGYPDPKDEIQMVKVRQEGNPIDRIRQVVTGQELLEMQKTVERTFLSDEIIAYAVDLVGATRQSELLLRGASPRATLAVLAMAKAVAQLRGRDFVTAQDVQEVFLPTVAHRLVLNHAAQSHSMDAGAVLEAILAKVPQPKLR